MLRFYRFLDPIHSQRLRFCLGAFRTSHRRSCMLGARRAKFSLHDASKMKSLPKHPTPDGVFDNKCMKLFDARPNTVCLCFKPFLTASKIRHFGYFGNAFVFLCYHRRLCILRKMTHIHLSTSNCLCRWFAGWVFCVLCYSFSIRHRNFHEITRFGMYIHR